MSALPPDAWADGFPELDDKRDRVQFASGEVSFSVTPGAMPDGSPGLAVCLPMPDGWYAVTGMHLIDLLKSLVFELIEIGWAQTVVLPGGGGPPPHTPN